jgi:hypothetical protein
VKPELRIVIGTVVFRNGLLSNPLTKHAAQCLATHGAGVNAKSNDSAGELVHDDRVPVGPQRGRLAPKRIYAPEAVLHVAQEVQPRGAGPIRIRLVVSGKNTANHVLVDIDSESQGDLKCPNWVTVAAND